MNKQNIESVTGINANVLNGDMIQNQNNTFVSNISDVIIIVDIICSHCGEIINLKNLIIQIMKIKYNKKIKNIELNLLTSLDKEGTNDDIITSKFKFKIYEIINSNNINESFLYDNLISLNFETFEDSENEKDISKINNATLSYLSDLRDLKCNCEKLKSINFFKYLTAKNINYIISKNNEFYKPTSIREFIILKGLDMFILDQYDDVNIRVINNFLRNVPYEKYSKREYLKFLYYHNILDVHKLVIPSNEDTLEDFIFDNMMNSNINSEEWCWLLSSYEVIYYEANLGRSLKEVFYPSKHQ